MKKDFKTFFIVNNLLIVIALIAARFDAVGVYATFFAISVAYQLRMFGIQES